MYTDYSYHLKLADLLDMTNKPMHQRQGWSPHPPIAPTLILSSIQSFLGDGVYIHPKDMHMYANTHVRSQR